MITLEQGITIARQIEDVLKEVNCHCALGGSVLHKGSSNKDLDIFIYHHDITVKTPDVTIIAALAKFINDSLHKLTSNYFDKEIYTSKYKGIRIDFFLL